MKMEENRREGAGFAGWDYKEIAAAGERAAFCLDCYQSFGWEPDQRLPAAKGRLLLRRQRRIMNKTELTRLQRHFEVCLAEIDALERSKTGGATTAALCVALGGTAFMAGSVFAVTHRPPLWVLSILLAVPGFLGWIFPVFLYRRVADRRARLVAALVEQKYDEICALCRQGEELLL